MKLINNITAAYKWFVSEKCDHCHGLLRKSNSTFHGAVEVNDTISGSKKVLFNLCNYCYEVDKLIRAKAK